MFSGYYYWGLIIPLMIISPLLFYVLPGKENAQKIGWRNVLNFVFGVLLSGWVGGMLAASLATYLNTPPTVTYNWSNPTLWLEGQHWFGSFTFRVFYIFSFTNFTKTKADLQFLDSCALVVCLLYSFGKIACFLAGHNSGCSGSASNLPWAVLLPYKSYAVHPRQVYDALFHLMLFAMLLTVHIKRKIPSGTIFFSFAVVHCCYSILSDILSENTRGQSGLTIGQLFFVVCFVYISVFYYTKLKSILKAN